MLTNYIQTKGYTYEKYIISFLQQNNEYDNIWLFKDVPEYIIAKTSLYDSYELYNSYRNLDIGADIVAIKNNIVYFIQCKNYDDIISINDLSSFYFLLYEFELNGIVYYNGKLSKRINDLSRGKVPYIHVPFNNQIIDNRIIRSNIDNKINLPKEYQLEAIKILKDKHRSILSLPCGMGKTYTAYLIAKTYKNIILISPTRTLAEELLTNMDMYLLFQYNPILISMDGSRDPSYIKSIIKTFNIFSVTYNSVDILNEIINIIDNPYIIIDEYHNLSEANLTDSNNHFNKILNSIHPILFLSATPIQTFNHTIFGNTIYGYSWTNAINNHFICDFKMIFPTKTDYFDIINKFLIEVNYNKKDIKLVNKAYFLIRSLLYEGSRKCIVYLTSIEISNKFKNIIDWMQKIFNCDINQYQIDCFTSKIKRVEYINNFKTDINISLMLNVQILNEGINIPICDSVYITKPNDNIINLIQRMSRANRILDGKNKCNIYIWCNKKKINNIINYINEQTNGEFKDKIFKYDYTEYLTDIQHYIKETKIIKEKFILTLFDKLTVEQYLIFDKLNNLWFNASNIAKILNYKKPNDAIRSLINNIYIKELKDIIDNYSIYNNAQPTSLYINEYGLYSLILNSNKKEAKSYYNTILDKLITL